MGYGFNGFYKSAESLASKTASWKAARARTHAGEGFIYLAALGRRHVKIGFSLDPRKRISGIRGEYRRYTPVRLLCQTPGTWEQEKALHRLLNGKASRNEVYPRSILTHEAIPEALRVAA